MKIFKLMLCIIISLILLMPLVAFAGYRVPIVQNDPVAIPTAKPVIDGVIGENEGWSDPAMMKDENVKYCTDFDVPFSTEAEIYFAYDENGLYYGADITELSEVNGRVTNNEFSYSTGEDTLDLTLPYLENVVGFNGDVFIFGLDPLGLYMQNGYISATDYTVWYCVGVFEGDEARMFRTRANTGDITDLVTIEGMGTDYGWSFEAYIPWTQIIEDMEAYTYGRVSCEVEDLIQGGAQHRSTVIYMDRYFSPEWEEVATRAKYMLACTTTHTGEPSHLLSGDFGALYGLDLYIEYNEPKYDDVAANAWYYDAVKYCFNKKYMNGTAPTLFDPDATVTREMFVKVLANLDGADTSSYTESSFNDVPTGAWYSEAIEWAYQNGLTTGVADGVFGLEQEVTREQIATFMMRYADYTHKNVTGRAVISSYKDASQVSDWAYDAMSWMVYKGFISGVTEDLLSPNTSATRAQFAQIVMKYMNEYGLDLFS